MRRSIHPRSARGGFTLVELLVVVTIIAVLLALIGSAVMGAFARGTDAQARNEISQLDAAINAFKVQFHVPYVPDSIILPPGYDTRPGNPTAVYLKSVWPRLDVDALGATGTNAVPIGSGANQRNVTVFEYWQVTGNQGQVLQGDQCLVFFVGGWRGTDGNVYGFSTDATDPMLPYTPTNPPQSRHGPYFEGFTAERLRVFNATGRANGFPSFVDVYGQVPYMYFSSAKAGNDYTTSPHVVPSLDATNQLTTKQVVPFKLSVTKFAKPSSFQIISAGRDGIFGAGGLGWAGVPNGTLSAGVRDDMGNFHASRLGD